MADLEEILDTTAGENGATKTIVDRRQRQGRGAHVQGEIGAGDTVVIQGRLKATLSWVTLATFTANGMQVIDLPSFYRAIRSVDGGGADSSVWVEKFDAN